MTEAFSFGLSRQREWHWLVTISFFLEGIGGGLYLVSLLAPSPPGVGLSIGLVLLGVLFLAADLGNMTRAWRALMRPQTSWISRGTLMIGAFVVLAILALIAGKTPVGVVLQTLAAVSACGVVAYSGFLVAQSPAVPSWNSALVPVLFILYAILGGTGVLFVVATGMLNAAPILAATQPIALFCLVAIMVTLAAHITIMLGSSVSNQETARMLLRGELRTLFLGGVVCAGLLVPLVLTLYSYTSPQAPTLVTGVSGILILVGNLLFRQAVLRAGVYASLL